MISTFISDQMICIKVDKTRLFSSYSDSILIISVSEDKERLLLKPASREFAERLTHYIILKIFYDLIIIRR